MFVRIREALAFESNILILGITSAVGTLGNSLWFFFLPLHLSDLGISPFEIGVVYTLGHALAFLLQVPGGYLADQYGRKPLIVLANLLSTFSVLFFALSNNFFAVFFAFLLFNTGVAFLSPALRVMLTESVPAQKRGTAVGSFFAIAPTLAILGPPVGGLIAKSFGFKLLFWLGFLLLLPTTAIRSLFLKETKKKVPSSQRREKLSLGTFSSRIRLLAHNRNLAAFVIAFGTYHTAMGLTGFLVPLFARDHLGLGQIEIGLMYSTLSATNVALAIPFGKLSDKIGRRKCIILSWAGENAFMLLFTFSTNSMMAILTFATWTAFGQMDIPAKTAWLSELTESEHRGTIMGLFSMLTSVSSLPSPSIGGSLYSFSPRFPFYGDALLSLLALSILLKFTVERKILVADSLD